MAKVESRSRKWFLTVNNWTEEMRDKLVAAKTDYKIICKELAPTTGTPHLHCWMYWKDGRTKSAMIKQFKFADIRWSNATAEEGKKYCIKGDDYEEFGTMPQQGKRHDIDECVEMINEGSSMREVAISNPNAYVKYNKGLLAYKCILIPPKEWQPEVFVYYGGPGSGKTRKAIEDMGDKYWMWAPQQEKWFDGYEGEECALFDEFRGEFPLGMFLNITDRYHSRVQYKGGMVHFSPKRIYITSPYHPSEWYSECKNEDVLTQVMRRITNITCFYTEVFTQKLGVITNPNINKEDVKPESFTVECDKMIEKSKGRSAP